MAEDCRVRSDDCIQLLTRDQRWQWLRASVVIEGRSLTLYEEAHPQKRLGHPQVHRRFVQQVAAMLPPGASPSC